MVDIYGKVYLSCMVLNVKYLGVDWKVVVGWL